MRNVHASMSKSRGQGKIHPLTETGLDEMPLAMTVISAFPGGSETGSSFSDMIGLLSSPKVPRWHGLGCRAAVMPHSFSSTASGGSTTALLVMPVSLVVAHKSRRTRSRKQIREQKIPPLEQLIGHASPRNKMRRATRGLRRPPLQI